MKELIEKLEALEGPDRELDAQIAVAGGQFERLAKTVAGTFVYPGGIRDGRRPPAYTASIDDALSLVPDGLAVEVGVYPAGDDMPPEGSFARVSDDCLGDGPGWEEDAYKGATPAIAICIAALRARLDRSGEVG